MSAKKQKGVSFDESLVGAMQCLDKQVARDVNTRRPQETAEQGVQKWRAHSERIESTTTLILDSIGDKEIDLDSVLILAQSFTKALSFISSDLGEAGLGDVRTQYCLEAFRAISRDCYNAESGLKDNNEMLIN